MIGDIETGNNAEEEKQRFEVGTHYKTVWRCSESGSISQILSQASSADGERLLKCCHPHLGRSEEISVTTLLVGTSKT
jgi:hypothetical protein